MNNEDQVFDKKELEILEEMFKIKKSIIDRLNIENINTVKEIEALLSTAESIENTIFKKKAAIAREVKNTNDSNLTSIALDLLKSVKEDKKENSVNNNIENIEIEQPQDIVPGETDIGEVKISYDEFKEKYDI